MTVCHVTGSRRWRRSFTADIRSNQVVSRYWRLHRVDGSKHCFGCCQATVLWSYNWWETFLSQDLILITTLLNCTISDVPGVSLPPLHVVGQEKSFSDPMCALYSDKKRPRVFCTYQVRHIMLSRQHCKDMAELLIQWTATSHNQCCYIALSVIVCNKWSQLPVHIYSACSCTLCRVTSETFVCVWLIFVWRSNSLPTLQSFPSLTPSLFLPSLHVPFPFFLPVPNPPFPFPFSFFSPGKWTSSGPPRKNFEIIDCCRWALVHSGMLKMVCKCMCF